MFHRLNFLLPNVQSVNNVTHDLHELGIQDTYIHSYSNNPAFQRSLPNLETELIKDKEQSIERLAWNMNLLIFFVLLGVCVFALISAQYTLAFICGLLMALSFLMGAMYALFSPTWHMKQFTSALSHNEILLSVDVDHENVYRVENAIHRHHPEVIEGGSSWILSH